MRADLTTNTVKANCREVTLMHLARVNRVGTDGSLDRSMAVKPVSVVAGDVIGDVPVVVRAVTS